MNMYKVFAEISNKLISNFKISAQIKHNGGKGSLREDFFTGFLSDYLPQRYGVGRGEVVTATNSTSGQLDVILYDPFKCPVLIISDSHAVYPVESVYGVISIKSTLNSKELEDAYKNIVNFKRLIPKEPFTQYPSSGLAIGMGPPIPVTGIVAYSVDRSLDAVAEQIQKLDSQLSDIKLRPDFVSIIGEGIVSPIQTLRKEFNNYKIPTPAAVVRATKRHTLLRTYLQLLRELNYVELRPLDLNEYLNMPELIGNHRVRDHNKLIRTDLTGKTPDTVCKLSDTAINSIIEHCNEKGSIPYRMHLQNICQAVPQGFTDAQLNSPIFEFNPNGLPPVDRSKLSFDEKGRLVPTSPCFQPIYLLIDDNRYAVDVSTFSDDCFEPNLDVDLDELFC